MLPKPTKKLGTLSLTILEHFIKRNFRDEFVKELREDYDASEVLQNALAKTETGFTVGDRFRLDFKDKYIVLSRLQKPTDV